MTAAKAVNSNACNNMMNYWLTLLIAINCLPLVDRLFLIAVGDRHLLIKLIELDEKLPLILINVNCFD